MKMLVFAMALLVSMPSLAQGGNVLEELTVADRTGPSLSAGADTDDTAPRCTADRTWCAWIERNAQGDGMSLGVYDGTRPPAEREVWRHALGDADDYGGPTFALWPRMVRLDASARAVAAPGQALESAVLIGVETHVSTGYSGGGASATDLQLLLVTRSAEGVRMREVLGVATDGSSLIRACFSERDMKQRAGACHDEYSFFGTLTLEPQSVGMPQFGYQTKATSFPGPVSRSEDSLQNPRLRKKDLVTVVDDACTYQRTWMFDPATGQYQPDAPLPTCDDYTVP
jgi:hypothetical protein